MLLGISLAYIKNIFGIHAFFSYCIFSIFSLILYYTFYTVYTVLNYLSNMSEHFFSLKIHPIFANSLIKNTNGSLRKTWFTHNELY